MGRSDMREYLILSTLLLSFLSASAATGGWSDEETGVHRHRPVSSVKNKGTVSRPKEASREERLAATAERVQEARHRRELVTREQQDSLREREHQRQLEMVQARRLVSLQEQADRLAVQQAAHDQLAEQHHQREREMELQQRKIVGASQILQQRLNLVQQYVNSGPFVVGQLQYQQYVSEYQGLAGALQRGLTYPEAVQVIQRHKALQSSQPNPACVVS